MVHKISRIVTKTINKKQYVIYLKKYLLLNNLKTVYLMTQGGFLEFEFDDSDNLDQIYQLAESAYNQFVSNLGLNIFDYCQLFTIGIDGKSKKKTIELVAIVRDGQKIQWTGKSYPKNEEMKHLILIENYQSHLINHGQDKVLVMGCHDLNVYNPRGLSKLKPNSKKYYLSKNYRESIESFKPTVVLQHPHTTVSPRTWQNAYIKMKNTIPTVSSFASGICYYDKDANKIRPLDQVLCKTKTDDCYDIII
jgi:hypothetical protein